MTAGKLMKLSDIKANTNNPRLIKDDKFKKLLESVKSFPEMLELRPIVVNKDMVILWGNMRYKACKEAWLKEIPVIVADNLTEEQEREFLIKDNVSWGEWDWDILANEWDKEELEEWGLDVQFETVEPTAEEDDFEVDEGIKTDIVLGDLFEIWEHRLLCWDSTNIDDVNKLMNGEKADMVFTDPPYNTGMGEKNRDSTWLNHMFEDSYTDEEWEQFMSDFCSMYFMQMKDDTETNITFWLDYIFSKKRLSDLAAEAPKKITYTQRKTVRELRNDFQILQEELDGVNIDDEEEIELNISITKKWDVRKMFGFMSRFDTRIFPTEEQTDSPVSKIVISTKNGRLINNDDFSFIQPIEAVLVDWQLTGANKTTYMNLIKWGTDNVFSEVYP